MRINHNIAALNTYNQLSKNTKLTNNALAKLSSGMRINKAGDDPAGLSISEKMRAQVRGLEQATDNAQDGISLIQTAEGALNETTSILQRMRELAVQAGNDTATQEDRDTIKDELDQLAQEITRIADTTKFNGKALMSSAEQFSGDLMIGSNSGENLRVTLEAMDADTLGVGFAATTTASVGEIAYVQGDTDEIGDVNLDDYTQSNNLDIKIVITKEGATDDRAEADVTINGVTEHIIASANEDEEPEFVLSHADFGDIFQSGQQVVITGAATPTVNDEINIKINGETTSITGLDVSTNDLAGDAVDAIDLALKDVSEQRSQLGAYQNRLEYTINNLGTAAENLTAAESRIRDVDMANEMMEFTKMNILSQAAQSMLAQANQQPQSVLQLLQ